MTDNTPVSAPRTSASVTVMMILGLLSLVLAVLLLLAIPIFIVPKFEAIFADFSADIPATTKAVINASNFISHYRIPVFLLAGLFIGGSVALVALLPEKRKLLFIIYSIAGWVILACIIVVCFFGLYLPLITLMTGMGNHSGS